MTSTHANLAPRFEAPSALVNAHLVALRPTDPGQLIPPVFLSLGVNKHARRVLREALDVCAKEHPWRWYKGEAHELYWFIRRFDESTLTQGRLLLILSDASQPWRVRLAIMCEVFRARLAPLGTKA